MARQSSAADGPRTSAGPGACTNAPLQGAQGDNPFSGLSDSQRRSFRLIIQEAGCFRCGRLKVIHGRNCNSYSCELWRTCPAITKTLRLYNLVVGGAHG
ncbi:MAG TPA: hypothetical protein PK280_17375 [Planctomycetota bacterium]|nr:hypothetical protein [Planctomycetota bacterium]